MAEGEGCAQPMYFLLAQLHYHGTNTHSCSATTSYVRGNVCSILNKADNGGETSEIGMYSKSLVHTYLHSAFFFSLFKVRSGTLKEKDAEYGGKTR